MTVQNDEDDFDVLREKNDNLCLDLADILFGRKSSLRMPNKRSREERVRALVKEVIELKENYLKEIDMSLFRDEDIARFHEENEKWKMDRNEIYDDHRRQMNKLHDVIDSNKLEEDLNKVRNEIHCGKIKYKELKTDYLNLKNKYNALKEHMHIDEKESNKKQKTV